MPSFTILGTDRARGALGAMVPFRFHVIAEDAEEARGRTYRLRALTRDHVHISACFETVSEADVRAFTEESGATDEVGARAALEELRQIGDALQAIDERRCNEPCGPEVDREERRLELQARTLLAGFGLRMFRQSDPRGRPIGFHTPRSLRFNTMGGAEDGWRL